MHHIFISPHLDDAIASCGGTISKLVDLGELVTIFNFFCGRAAPPYSPEADSLHELWGNPKDVVRLRRAEDEAAAAKLGAFVHFTEGIPDSLYRKAQDGNWMYGNEGDIFGSRHPDDDKMVPKLTRKVQEFHESRESRIYIPLGIGRHVDHLIAFEVGQSLLQDGYEVIFYEDFPYANNEKLYKERTASLSNWSTMVVTFNEDQLHSKIEAFSYYRSQIPMLFESGEKMYDMFIFFAKKVSGSGLLGGERYWIHLDT